MPMKIALLRRMTSPLLVAFVISGYVFLFSGALTVSAKSAADSPVVNWHPASLVSQDLIQNSVPSSQQAAAASAQSHKHQIRTIPYWTSSFRYQGQTYPYSMVGTNPTKGSAVTVVPALLIPVKLVLSDGSVYNGERKVRAALNSPLFRPSSFSSGYTQYGDAIQRAEFWKYISTKSQFYHVWLTPPAVLPTLKINVPADQGGKIKRPSGVVFAGIDVNYLDNQLQTYMQQHHISPRTLPIFLTSDVLGTDQNGTLCCIGGYHNALPNANNSVIQTYAYATYDDPGFSLKNPKVFTTTDALSHEISEWYNDPFINNVVPNWSVPSQPQYGCNNALEVGDPLVGVGFDIGDYHLQDEAFFSWFARQTPSIGINGKYSYLGTFTTVASSC